jgi:hypothetical protein
MEPKQPNPQFEQLIAQMDLLMNDIEKQPGLAVETLGAQEVAIMPSSQSISDQAVNETLGVSQDLVSLVQAGDEFFGIVNAFVLGQEQPSQLLVRVKTLDGTERPEVISKITDEPLVVGRGAIEDAGEGLSRSHFEVVKKEDGSIKVTDLGSTNKTRIATTEKNVPLPDSAGKTTFSGLKKLLRSNKLPQQIPVNPLDDFRFWAAKSKDIVEFLGEDEPYYIAGSGYEAPKDQLAAEFALIDDFRNKFPNQVDAFTESLSDVKRFAGIGIPKYRLAEGQPGDGSLNDENGYLKSDEEIFSALLLQVPLERPSQEEFQKLSYEEQQRFMVGESGIYIVGNDVPEHTRALLEGLYGLTGAKTLFDERAEGLTRGTVIRQGMYQGTPVYFRELFSTYIEVHSSGGVEHRERRTLRVDMLNEKDALNKVYNDMKDGQLEEFSQLTGIDPIAVRAMHTRREINRHNYRDVAALLVEANSAVESDTQNG